MDLGTIVGILMGCSLIAWAVISGGNIKIFLDAPSFLITIGGGFSATMVAFPLPIFKNLISIASKAMSHKATSLASLIDEMVSYATVARRDGILSLEALTRDIEDPFLLRGIQMAVDGTDPELIEQIMLNEIDGLDDRHNTGIQLFKALGTYFPAFGMIGTLVGLVAMLANLEDPDSIGKGMAVALLTTLYGAFVANLFVLPIADKLARRHAEEMLVKSVVVKGVMSIQSGDNPRIVEQKLKTFLPPAERRMEEE